MIFKVTEEERLLRIVTNYEVFILKNIEPYRKKIYNIAKGLGTQIKEYKGERGYLLISPLTELHGYGLGLDGRSLRELFKVGSFSFERIVYSGAIFIPLSLGEIDV